MNVPTYVIAGIICFIVGYLSGRADGIKNASMRTVSLMEKFGNGLIAHLKENPQGTIESFLDAEKAAREKAK